MLDYRRDTRMMALEGGNFPVNANLRVVILPSTLTIGLLLRAGFSDPTTTHFTKPQVTIGP
jgi:hypothetical protein